MLERIAAALQARADLDGWSARLVRSREVQLFAVPDAVETALSDNIDLACQEFEPVG